MIGWVKKVRNQSIEWSFCWLNSEFISGFKFQVIDLTTSLYSVRIDLTNDYRWLRICYNFIILNLFLSTGKYEMGGCAVALCSSPKGQSYHRFPKDPKLRKLWVQACKRHDDFDVNTCRVCGSHFDPDDFERDLRNELLGNPLIKNLKPGVF